MSTFTAQWLKKNSVILFNTASLVGTMLVTSVLGFAYWIVAARYYPTEAVGLASAATSAMMLLSTLFLLGQGTLLISEIPRNKGQEGSLISASVSLVGLSSFVGGVIFAVSSSRISPQLRFLGESPLNVLLFASGVSLAAVTVILDQAIIGLLQGGLQLWRNTLFAVAKLALLVVAGLYLAKQSGISIYTVWTAGNIISLLPIIIFIIKKKKWSLKYYIPQWGMIRKLGSSALQHHILNLILQAPTQALPILVTILLSAKMNAWFYIASMIANFVFSLSLSLTTVLHAANAAQTSTLTQKTRLTVSLSLLSGVVISAILIIGAGPILNIFGSSYATHAAMSLRILLLAAVPLIIKNHYIAICRIKDELRQAIVPVAVGAVLEFSIAALGAHVGGLEGLSLGWVIAMLLESLIMLPVVIRTLIGRSALDRYLDEIAATETVLLPAFNFQPSGAIYLSTFGNSMALAELDTTRLPRVPRVQAQQKMASMDLPDLNYNMTDILVRDEESVIFPRLSHGKKEAMMMDKEPIAADFPYVNYTVDDVMMNNEARTVKASSGSTHAGRGGNSGALRSGSPLLTRTKEEAAPISMSHQTVEAGNQSVPLQKQTIPLSWPGRSGPLERTVRFEQPRRPGRSGPLEEMISDAGKPASAKSFHMPGKARLVKQADIAEINTMQVQHVEAIREKKDPQ